VLCGAITSRRHNRIQSSRRLEREAKRNLEVIWLARRLTPDDKTIADFRKDNSPPSRRFARASSSYAPCERKAINPL